MKESYDIVIPTRNRPDALKLSIPSILTNQIPLPQNFIIVDSSDNKQPTIDVISALQREYNIEFTLLESPHANLCFQRNLGLKYVSANIVIFPDDDSIFYPGAINEILRIYEKDTEHIIAGVCAAEATEPPLNFPILTTYSQTKSDKIKKNIGKIRYTIEHFFCPDPFQTFGKILMNSSRNIDWLTQDNVVKVEYMTGFRMSFRTRIFNHFQFNELFDSYCLFEDVDACFSASKNGILVGARNAKIYHHKFPANRSGGFKLGFWQIFNRGYIIAKHTQPNRMIVHHLIVFTFYKLLLYLLTSHTSFGRKRFQGALLAAKNLSKLLKAKPEELEQVYSKIIKKADG